MATAIPRLLNIEPVGQGRGVAFTPARHSIVAQQPVALQRVVSNALASKNTYPAVYIQTSFVNGDAQYAIRAGMDILNSSGNSSLSHSLSNGNLFYHTLGISTAVAFPNGIIEVNNALNQLQAVEKINYEKDKAATKASVAQSFFYCLGGAAFTVYRPLAIASAIKGVDASGFTSATLLGRLTYAIGTIGNAFWGFFYLFLGIKSSLREYYNTQFRLGLSYGTEVERFEFLRDKYFISAADVAEIERNNAQFSEQASRHIAQEMLKLSKGSSLPPYSEREWEVLIQKMLGEDRLKEVGRKMAFDACDARKKRDIGSHAGKKAQEALDAVKRLEEQFNIADATHRNELQAKKAEAVETALAYNNDSCKVNASTIALCTLAVAASIGLFVFTGGIGLLAVCVAFFVANLLMTYTDVKGFILDLENGRMVNERDILFNKIYLALGIIAMVTSLVLTSIFSFGVVPLVLTLIGGTSWIANSVFMHKKMCESREKNPTLDFFKEVVENKSGYSYSQVQEMYQRLSPEDRTLIGPAMFLNLERDSLVDIHAARARLQQSIASAIEGRRRVEASHLTALLQALRAAATDFSRAGEEIAELRARHQGTIDKLLEIYPAQAV